MFGFPQLLGFINGGGPSVPTLEEIVDTKQWGRETVRIDGTFPNFNEWESVNAHSVPSFMSPVLVHISGEQIRFQRGEQNDNKRKSLGTSLERSRLAP